MTLSSLEVHLKKLEEQLLHADIKSNPELLDELLSEDFEEINSSGVINSREDVVNWLLNKGTEGLWSITDFSIRQLADDLFLATYHSKCLTLEKDKVAVKNNTHIINSKTTENNSSKGSLRSSLWRRHSSSGSHPEWQMIFHQGTKISKAKNGQSG